MGTICVLNSTCERVLLRAVYSHRAFPGPGANESEFSRAYDSLPTSSLPGVDTLLTRPIFSINWFRLS